MMTMFHVDLWLKLTAALPFGKLLNSWTVFDEDGGAAVGDFGAAELGLDL